MCAAFQPTVVWSEVVLIKTNPTRPPVYLGPVTSNKFTSTQIDCSPLEFCGNQPGPVSDDLKSAFAKALRDQGVIVVTQKPSNALYDTISVSIISDELPSHPPVIPKRFVCDLMGGITRLGPDGKLIRLKELEFHNKQVHPADESPSSLVKACFKRTAELVKKGLTEMNQPQKKKDK